MLMVALLLSLWAAICSLDEYSTQLQLYRPLFAGSITGLILGDFTQGMIIASTLELMWLGVAGMGAYTPPDVVTGAVIGTAFGILSGKGAVAGVAIAVPISMITQQLIILSRTITIGLVHKADKAAEDGNFDSMDKYHLLGLPLFALTRAIPVFLAIYFGTAYVQKLFSVIPSVILDGLKISGSILPAVGFAMLLTLMLNKKLWPFVVVGFVCSAYGKIPTVGLALIGISLAFFYDAFTAQKPAAEKPNDNNHMEGGYDL